MEYTYDVCDAEGVRIDTTTNFSEIVGLKKGYIVVYKGTEFFKTLNTVGERLTWERELKHAVRPTHRYTYLVYATNAVNDLQLLRKTTDLDSLKPSEYSDGSIVQVYDNVNPAIVCTLTDEEEYEAWRIGQEMGFTWRPDISEDRLDEWEPYPEDKVAWEPFKELQELTAGQTHSATSASDVASAVNPSHYKEYIADMQWIEAMQYVIPDFDSAIELQVRKYLDRNGKKDAPLQELSKALWYLKFWVARKKAQKNIRVDEVEKWLTQV